MVLTNAYALSMEKQLPINVVNNLRSLSPTKRLLIQKDTLQGNCSHSYRSQMRTLGLQYFCHRLFQHLLISQSEETSRAEDMPARWKFLPKIAIAEQIARPTEVDDGLTSGLCATEQLSSMVGIFSMFKSFFGPTADFLLYHILLSFLFSQGVTSTSFHTGLSLVSSFWNYYTAVPSCLAVTTALAGLIFPH